MNKTELPEGDLRRGQSALGVHTALTMQAMQRAIPRLRGCPWTPRSMRSTANRVKQAAYQEAHRRCSKADCHHLQTTLTPVPDQSLGGINSHAKQCDCGERYRANNSRRARDDHERE